MIAADAKQPDVIVATVGKQPMPILIPILQFRPTFTQLIVTDEVQEVAQHIREAVRVDPKTADLPVYSHEPVNPHDARDTYERCEAILDNPRFAERQFAINITGGTTLMNLGAQKAAGEFRVPMLYVDTDDEVIVHLSPDGQETNSPEDVTVRVSAQVYLAAHGASVSLCKPWGQGIAQQEERVQSFVKAACLLGRAGSRSARLLDEIRAAYYGPDKIVTLPDADAEERELAGKLAQQGLLAEPRNEANGLSFHVVNERHIHEFLTGRWLELYVYDACVTSGLFDDVLLDVMVSRPAKPRPVKNQLDVVAVWRGRLAVISCKTGRRQMEDKDENKWAVYELDSLLQAELMGLYARKVLVSNRDELPLALVNRAHLSQVKCVTGPQLIDVARIVRQHLEEPLLRSHL